MSRGLSAMTLTAAVTAERNITLQELLRFRSRNLYTVLRRGGTASLLQRNPHPDIGFLDDIRQGRCIGDTQGLFASAFRVESTLRNHAGRWAAPCTFQRCIVGHQRAEFLCDHDSKDHPYLTRRFWKTLGVRCKAEGKVPTVTPELSFATPPKDELRENCIKWRRAGPHLHLCALPTNCKAPVRLEVYNSA